jgi:hypothetical protein
VPRDNSICRLETHTRAIYTCGAGWGWGGGDGSTAPEVWRRASKEGRREEASAGIHGLSLPGKLAKVEEGRGKKEGTHAGSTV